MVSYNLTHGSRSPLASVRILGDEVACQLLSLSVAEWRGSEIINGFGHFLQSPVCFLSSACVYHSKGDLSVRKGKESPEMGEGEYGVDYCKVTHNYKLWKWLQICSLGNRNAPRVCPTLIPKWYLECLLAAPQCWEGRPVGCGFHLLRDPILGKSLGSWPWFPWFHLQTMSVCGHFPRRVQFCQVPSMSNTVKALCTLPTPVLTKDCLHHMGFQTLQQPKNVSLGATELRLLSLSSLATRIFPNTNTSPHSHLPTLSSTSHPPQCSGPFEAHWIFPGFLSLLVHKTSQHLTVLSRFFWLTPFTC